MIGIVNQFRTLSAQPAAQIHMVQKQNVLPSLVTFLHVDDKAVVVSALATLKNLASQSGNVQTMREWDGLAGAISAWTTRAGTTAEIIKLSGEVLTALGFATPTAAASGAAGSEAVAAEDEADESSDDEDEESSDDEDEEDAPPALMGPPALTPMSPNAARLNSPARAGPSSVAGGKGGYGMYKTPTRSSSYTIQIEGLSAINRSLIERKLLQQQGIVSFTINVESQTAVIRTREDPETVTKALESIGYHASVMGDEAAGLATVGLMSGVKSGKENSMPAYASDEKFINSKFTVVDSSGDHSLAGRRRARERRQRQQESKVSSLLSRVGSWLW